MSLHGDNFSIPADDRNPNN